MVWAVAKSRKTPRTMPPAFHIPLPPQSTLWSFSNVSKWSPHLVMKTIFYPTRG